MAANLTKYQQFDPDTDYEIDDGPDFPEEPDSPEAIVCCQCVINGDQSLCKSEGSFGAASTSIVARTTVYWGTWS